ncbi:MAG TPA: hypothetical protein VFH83_13475 [Spirochaetia bacterium]|nr:hypothetical protein [Spirochaetia bacterium]
MSRSLPLLACTLLVLAAPVAIGAPQGDFDRVVAFDITLKSLASDAASGAPLPNRVIILDGTVSDVNVVDKNAATFKVRIQMIAGEWIGLDDVKSYTCYVDFSGSQYASVFPARPPAAAKSGVVTLNSRVLVVGRPVSLVSAPDGSPTVLVEGMHVRSLE